MATAQLDMVIRHIRRAVLRKDAAARTDGQLLASFIEHKDEMAFEALVHRHGPMVFGVCRRVVGNHHDAEDAFQATFLVLARKARSVRPRERVANWLHGVALRTAMKARTMTARRKRREKQVVDMPEPQAPQQDTWPDLQRLIDQELNGVPENYRLPVLLCDLEGKTIKEATQQLGWPQGTLAGRLARGRKLLAKRLAKRGVVLSAGSLAMVVSQNVASASVLSSLISATTKAAIRIATGKATVAGVVPAKVASLLKGVMTSMMLAKLKTITPLLVLGVVALGGGLLVRHPAAAQQAATQNDDKRPAMANAPLPGPREQAPPRLEVPVMGTIPVALDFGFPQKDNAGTARSQEIRPAIAAGQRKYVITSALVEARKGVLGYDAAGVLHQQPDQRNEVLRLPQLIVDDGQLVPLHIAKAPQDLQQKIVADEKMKIGAFCDARVKRLAGNKARLFLSFQVNEVEKSSVSELRVTGNSVQTIQDVELHKPVKVVFQKNAAGSPVRWVEITLDEQIAPADEQITPAPPEPNERKK